MKKVSGLILFLCFHFLADAQLVKDIKRGVKNDVEWRIQRKVRDKMNEGVDSLEKLPKKIKNKKEQKKATDQQNDSTTKSSNTTVAGAKTSIAEVDQNEIPEEGEGFITLRLSTPVTTKGLSVIISGESIKYENWNAVKVVIKYLGLGGNDSAGNEEEVSVALNDSGKYNLFWDKLPEDGDYLITATSSDGKAKVSERLWVKDWQQPQDETKDLMDATGEAFQRLKAKEYDLQPLISHKDMTALLAKVAQARERLDALHKFLNSLKKAKKEIGDLLKIGKVPSKNIRENLTLLNQMIASKAVEVKKIKEITGEMNTGQSNENTICEYIAMLNEACAAFSTITNGWTKTLGGVIKNIILDKGVPKLTEKIINVAPDPDDVFRGEASGDEATWGAKEASKIFATAKFDMEGLTGKLGKAGFAGDVVQFATDVLMKTHCGIFKGKLTHYYNFIAKNEQGKSWWDYGVASEAAFVLRYPKSSSGIIKMKGTIEGNATKFEFFADPRQNPDYSQGTAGKVQTMMLKSYNPYALPFAGSLHDELGFGMMARAVATPAYFLIPVDAEYNTQTGKIKISISEALVDFLPTVFNSQIFIQWSAGLPKLRRQDYPISKARLTIKAALKEKNEFATKKDAKGNLYISETVKRHIGSESTEREHFLDVSISAKKE
jgi:hypothetical protein